MAYMCSSFLNTTIIKKKYKILRWQVVVQLIDVLYQMSPYRILLYKIFIAMMKFYGRF